MNLPAQSSQGFIHSLSERLRGIILTALPDATENLSGGLNVFSVKRRICFVKTTGGILTLGFYGDLNSNEELIKNSFIEEGCLCYVDIAKTEEINARLYTNILQYLAY
jgi:hypothetical protein